MVPSKSTAKTKRQTRSLDLMATFVEGYAEGWFYAVGECFKDQLDIKYTERIEPVMIDGIQQYQYVKEANGVTKKKKMTQPIMQWTQGRCYAFEQGHIIYDTPEAYRTWSDALQHIRYMCFIVRAIPSGIDELGFLIQGRVTFTVSEPNADRSGLVTTGEYDLAQDEFVEYLKSGTFEKLFPHNEQLNLFSENDNSHYGNV